MIVRTKSKSLKGKPLGGVQAKNAKSAESMRSRGQVCNNGARWQLYACVLFASACLCAYASACVRVCVCVSCLLRFD